jgi:hypothetical protein
METQLFRSQGKKWAVTVVKTTLTGYHPGSKAPRRKAVVAVLRHAHTGEPFTGTAILSPKDKDVDFEAAKKLAIKRAIRASFVGGYGCWCPSCKKDYFNEMWRAYRLSVLRSTDPIKWANVTHLVVAKHSVVVTFDNGKIMQTPGTPVLLMASPDSLTEQTAS